MLPHFPDKAHYRLSWPPLLADLFIYVYNRVASYLSSMMPNIEQSNTLISHCGYPRRP